MADNKNILDRGNKQTGGAVAELLAKGYHVRAMTKPDAENARALAGSARSSGRF
jgi:hypothetical protein